MNALNQLQQRIEFPNPEYFSRVILVTPEIAKQWLDNNSMNRKINALTVDFYADQMKRGKWAFTSEHIIIGKSGRLLDGQQRLSAIIKANVSLYFAVAFNVSEETFPFINQQKKRTPGDVFKINGVIDSTTQASIINRYVTLRKGLITSTHNGSFNSRDRAYIKLGISDMLDIYTSAAQFWDQVKNESRKFYKRFRHLSTADYGSYAAYLILDKHHNDEFVFEFFEQLSSGGMSIKNNTINVLREKLANNAISHTKMTGLVKHSLIVKTWNAYVLGKNIKNLFFNQDKESKPEFI